jgi:hypothetical protein
VELPLFYGDNAYQWLQDCEGVFELADITNDYKLKWAATHIRGKPNLAQQLQCSVDTNEMDIIL